ncbi:MAG: carboxypeptidase regulatory-like domain-containing protein, partial [Casimicrobium sp.]
MNADGTHVTRLTYSLSSDREPAISPDGKTIAFVSDRHNDATSSNRTADLYLMNIDGTNLRRLTVDALPTNFSCDSCNLFGPVWSPSGTQIAFSNQKAIFVVDVSSGVKTQLSTPPTGFSDSNPTWSPDATKIAFDRGNGQGNTTIYVMSADGTNPTQLPYFDLAIQPAWSPDGSKIAFVGFRFSNAMINIINADGTGAVRTLNNATTAILGVPRWSLDGRYIAFESRTIDGSASPASNSPAVELYLVDVEDTVRIRLTRNDTHDESPSFGAGSVPTNVQLPPTGFGRVAFMGGFTPVIGNPGVFGLFTMNSEGWDIRLAHIDGTDITVGGVRTLTTYSSPGFSADGNHLAMVKSTFHTIYDFDSKLALMNGDGTNETIIPVYENNGNNPPTLTNVGSPALNPDGTKIAFATGRWGGLDFGIANADANLTSLFKWSHERLAYASWNPVLGDGRITYGWFNAVGKPTIAVASSCCSIVFDASADPPYSGDTLDRGIGYYSQCGAWPDGPVKKTFIGPPVWTSDGQSVAFVRQTLTQSQTSIANCGIGEDKIELVVENAATHAQTVIFQSDVINPTVVNPGYILQMAWSPQNNKLALLLNSNLYVMNSDGTNLKPITYNSGSSGFTLLTDNLSWLPTNFTQLPAVNYSIGGQVKDALGNPSSGVLITLSGGTSATTTSDASGHYVFSNLLGGGNYTVTPT